MEQKRTIRKGTVPISVSVYDLNHCLAPAGKEFEHLTYDEQNEILKFIGFDIAVETEWGSFLHRTKFKPNNEPHQGILITGCERVDREWMLFGKPTMENRINQHAGSGFNTELLVMSAQSNFTADICNHVRNGKDTEKK